MTKGAREKQNLVHTISLPKVARTPSGIEFEPSREVWSFRDALNLVHADFRELKADEGIVHGAKSVLVWYAENLASASLSANYFRFKHFCEVVTEGIAGRTGRSMRTT